MELLPTLAAGSVDLTVTSPPYDDLRTYGGSLSDWNAAKWQAIITELYRVTKDGGVVVWVVADGTVNGSETGTSFRQALHAMKCGFRLHDTMIYEKAGTGACGSNYAYWQAYEFMFVWSKGRPASVNRIADRPNARQGAVVTKGRIRAGGAERSSKRRTVPPFSVRTNIWRYQPSNGNDRTGHPAPFPEALARDHILSWSNEGDTVLDPFAGSGTTGKMSFLHGRNFIGVEREPKYLAIAERRIADAIAGFSVEKSLPDLFS